MMKLVLLGPPGSGKGTQCKRVIEKYNLTHMSSGDILRAERAANSELGQKAQGYMDAGQLVPDDLIISMMIGAIQKAEGGYVLDGFPRTVVQGEELDKALEEAKRQIPGVEGFHNSTFRQGWRMVPGITELYPSIRFNLSDKQGRVGVGKRACSKQTVRFEHHLLER